MHSFLNITVRIITSINTSSSRRRTSMSISMSKVFLIMVISLTFLVTVEAKPGLTPSDKTLNFNHDNTFVGHNLPIIPSDAVRIISINVNGGLTTSWQALLGKHRFATAHKFTDCMKYKQDLRPALMCLQETGGTRDLSNIISSKLLKGFGRFYHGPASNAHQAGLAIIADKSIAPRIHGGSSNETGTIQITQLGTVPNNKRKDKRHLVLFNIYAPTAPTSSNARWCHYLEWLDVLASKVDMYTTEENTILIIGDWNVAPDGSKDRNSSNISRSINTSRAKEAGFFLSE